ncbi:LOW QUALITY PROTEIN: hypothetical protein ACHAW6_007253 [Cyclotella cf. meneghiniana]
MQLTGKSNTVVVTDNGSKLPASNTALLNTTVLSKGALEAIVVSGMQQKTLLNVATLADNVIFSPGQQGIVIYQENNVNTSLKPALEGWRDERGLWIVLIADNTNISPNFDATSFKQYKPDMAMHVNELPSTEEVVRFLHAELGFPTKATLLTTAR